MRRRCRFDHHVRSKVRGARRKCRGMIESIRRYTETFPEEGYPGAGNWHLHLPVDQGFIDSEKTPHWVRRLCAQCLIDRTEYLRGLKPTLDEAVRAVALISLPKLWDSEVIVFFGEAYFGAFFERDSECQVWTPLREARSLVREWGLEMPGGFEERGYHERIRDENYSHDGEVWFVGELS